MVFFIIGNQPVRICKKRTLFTRVFNGSTCGAGMTATAVFLGKSVYLGKAGTQANAELSGVFLDEGKPYDAVLYRADIGNTVACRLKVYRIFFLHGTCDCKVCHAVFRELHARGDMRTEFQLTYLLRVEVGEERIRIYSYIEQSRRTSAQRKRLGKLPTPPQGSARPSCSRTGAGP